MRCSFCEFLQPEPFIMGCLYTCEPANHTHIVGISHVVVYIPLSMWIWIRGCVWLSAPFIRLTLVPVLSCGKLGNVMGNGVSTMFPQDKFTGRVSRLLLTTISLNKNTNPLISISH